MIEPLCSNCRAFRPSELWRDDSGRPLGWCVRHAPRRPWSLPGVPDSISTAWPLIAETDGCFEIIEKPGIAYATD